MNVTQLLTKEDKSGYLSRENYVKENYVDLYNHIIKFCLENDLTDLPFNIKKWHAQYNVKERKKCQCGKNLTWKNATIGYPLFCSVKCGSKSKETKEKYKKTMLQKYGIDHNSKADDYIIKKNKTMIERYGVHHPSLKKENQEKIINERIVNIQRFINNNGVVINAISKNEIEIKCNICYQNYILNYHFLYQRTNVNFHKINPCIHCNPRKNNSFPQDEIYNFLKKHYNSTIIMNDRIAISPKEIDIYLPEINLGIELNGIYYHSSVFKEKMYHQNKWKLCKEKNIKLIQIWEDDWFFKKDIIKSRILNLLKKNVKIHARKTTIKIVNKKTTDAFLNENHLQGSCIFKYSYGLYFKNELISIMTFGSVRKINNQKNVKNEYELLRFCSIKNTSVVGGANKLFNYFIKNVNVLKVISYANLDWGNSNVYSNLGFIFDCITAPGYTYYISSKGIREHRFNWNKKKLISLGYDKDKSEEEIMFDLGNYKCYNSGNEKWIWTKFILEKKI